MNITVLTTDVDTDAINAFCTATGYDPNSGQSQTEWLEQKISDWVTDNVSSGFMMQNIAPAQVQFNAAAVAASQLSQQQMSGVTIGVTDGSTVISPPIKVQ